MVVNEYAYPDEVLKFLIVEKLKISRRWARFNITLRGILMKEEKSGEPLTAEDLEYLEKAKTEIRSLEEFLETVTAFIADVEKDTGQNAKAVYQELISTASGSQDED